MAGSITVSLKHVKNFYPADICECIVRYQDPNTKIVYKRRISFAQARFLSQLEDQVITALGSEETALLKGLQGALLQVTDVISVTELARNCDYILILKD